jgi:uncharacterized RDD family membrane protein YckC
VIRKVGGRRVVYEQLGVVTPEAVVLDFQTANVGSRALARGIDLVIQFLALSLVTGIIAFVAQIVPASQASVIGAVVSLIVVFLVVFGYPALFESLWNGQTPGKAMVGVRVLTREGGPIRFRHAAVRSLIGFIEVFVFSFIAVLSTVLSRTNQRVGDMAGGTIVVRERTAGGSSTTVSYPPPPGLDAYVRTLDVTSVNARQYSVVRSYLLRVENLRPAVRATLAVRMANPVAVAMRHEPPPGLPPELFLVCVASAYQIRHGGPGAVWSAPGWPGYGMPKGWGFPPGFNGLMPAPPAGMWGGYEHAGWAPPQGATPGGWGAPPPGPAPPPNEGGWGPPPPNQGGWPAAPPPASAPAPPPPPPNQGGWPSPPTGGSSAGPHQ